MSATPGRELGNTGTHVQARLEHLARLKGWLVYHTHDSRHSEPGFPDLICLKEDILLALECKGEYEKLIPAGRGGRVSGWRYLPGQQDWLDAFAQVQVVKSLLVRPSNEAEARAMILEAVGMKALE